MKWRGRRQSYNVEDRRRDKQRQRHAERMIKVHGEWSFPSDRPSPKPTSPSLGKKTGMPNPRSMKRPRLKKK